MLAGILITVLVVAGMAFAVPHIAAQRVPENDLADELTQRFANSARILTRDVTELGKGEDLAAISTPLTRRSQLRELRLIASQAARRRRIVLLTLSSTFLLLLVLGLAGVTPGWLPILPVVLIVAFVAVARFSVVAMHRNLDARAEAIKAGFDDNEDTAIIELADDEASAEIELSVDLSTGSLGALWDPIPVTPATYVSQPLLPRTVRTIDLSAPVVAKAPVPTADNLDRPATEETQRPRAVGE